MASAPHVPNQIEENAQDETEQTAITRSCSNAARQFDEIVPESEYYSFDYQYHQHKNYWDGMSLLIPCIGLTLMFLMLLLIVLPFVAGFFIIGFMCILCSLLCGKTQYHFYIFSRARQARHVIKNQPGLISHQHSSTASGRDWADASGFYVSRQLNHGDTNDGQQELELVFAPPVQQKQEEVNSRVWNVFGKSQDASVVILHGLIAENGKVYWLERHSAAKNGLADSKLGSGGLPGLQRLVLVEGVFDYETSQFTGTWSDSQGNDGTYTTLARLRSVSAADNHHDTPFDEDDNEQPKAGDYKRAPQ